MAEDSVGAPTSNPTEIEIRNQFSLLRSELLDHRANTITWWLTAIAIILTMFTFVAALGGYIAVNRFQELETEARRYIGEMKEVGDRGLGRLEGILQEARNMTSEDADDPNKAKRVEEALKQVQRSPAATPLDVAIAEALALQRNSEIRKAVEKWRSIANVSEGTDKALAARAWFSVGYLLGEGLGTEEDWHKAVSAYDQAIRLMPGYYAAYLNRGAVKERQGNYQEAIVDYDEAIRLKPDQYFGYLNRGNAKANQGRHEAAIADYDQAIRLKPDSPDAYFNRGVSNRKLGRYDKTIADYDEAIRLNPGFYQAYSNRCYANTEQGHYAEAITDCNEAIRLKPDLASAYDTRCYANARWGRFTEAIADCDEAIRLEPDHHEIYTNRGIAKAGLGQWEEALRDYDYAISIKNDYPKAYYNRGMARIEMNLESEAREDLEAALELSLEINDKGTADRAKQELSKLTP